MGNSKWKRVLSVVKRDGGDRKQGKEWKLASAAWTVLLTVAVRCEVIF